jgi:hypothetical protein
LRWFATLSRVHGRNKPHAGLRQNESKVLELLLAVMGKIDVEFKCHLLVSLSVAGRTRWWWRTDSSRSLFDVDNSPADQTMEELEWEQGTAMDDGKNKTKPNETVI